MKEIEEQLIVELKHIGFEISVTQRYWEYITTIKHPYMKRMKSDVIITADRTDRVKEGTQIWKKLA